jgi:hypothetical protein
VGALYAAVADSVLMTRYTEVVHFSELRLGELEPAVFLRGYASFRVDILP